MRVFLLLISFACQAQFFGFGSNARLGKPQSTADFNTVTSQVNAYFDRAFYAKNAYKDRSATSISNTTGDSVLGIKDAITGTQILTFTTATPTNPITDLNTQTSTFPCYGAPDPNRSIWPYYTSSDNGAVSLWNSSHKSVSTTFSPDKTMMPSEYWVIGRFKHSEFFEQFSGGYGSDYGKFVSGELFNSGMSGGSGGGGPFIGFSSDVQGKFNPMQMTLYCFVNSGDSIQLLQTDANGDLRNQGKTYTGGTGWFWRTLTIGSDGHGQNQDFIAGLIKFGVKLTASQRTTALTLLKQVYPIGQNPSKPWCDPVLTVSGTGSTLKWTVTLNYHAGDSGQPIDTAATIINWYYGDQKGNVTSNMLDKQALIRTTSAGVLSLTRSSWPTYFPSTHDSNGNYLMVGVIVKDIGGNYLYQIPSIPIQDNSN